MPKKYIAFSGLQHIDMPMLCGHSILNMAVIGAPPVKEALFNMIRTGEMVQDYLKDMIDLSKYCVNAGYPVFGSAVVGAPFDEFADYIRGLITTCIDMKTNPELLDEAIN